MIVRYAITFHFDGRSPLRLKGTMPVEQAFKLVADVLAATTDPSVSPATDSPPAPDAVDPCPVSQPHVLVDQQSDAQEQAEAALRQRHVFIARVAAAVDALGLSLLNRLPPDTVAPEEVADWHREVRETFTQLLREL